MGRRTACTQGGGRASKQRFDDKHSASAWHKAQAAQQGAQDQVQQQGGLRQGGSSEGPAASAPASAPGPNPSHGAQVLEVERVIEVVPPAAEGPEGGALGGAAGGRRLRNDDAQQVSAEVASWLGLRPQGACHEAAGVCTAWLMAAHDGTCAPATLRTVLLDLPPVVPVVCW